MPLIVQTVYNMIWIKYCQYMSPAQLNFEGFFEISNLDVELHSLYL